MDTLIREIQKEDDAAVEQVIRACLIEFGGDHEGTAWCYLETLENMTAAQRFYEKKTDSCVSTNPLLIQDISIVMSGISKN